MDLVFTCLFIGNLKLHSLRSHDLLFSQKIWTRSKFWFNHFKIIVIWLILSRVDGYWWLELHDGHICAACFNTLTELSTFFITSPALAMKIWATLLLKATSFTIYFLILLLVLFSYSTHTVTGIITILDVLWPLEGIWPLILWRLIIVRVLWNIWSVIL